MKIVDKSGAVVHRGLTHTAADAIVETLLAARPSLLGLKVMPDDDLQPFVSQSETPLAVRKAAAEAATAHAARAIEPGQERGNLLARLATREVTRQAVAAAEQAAATAANHLGQCEAEVARLTQAREAEIADAGLSLAERLKAGDAQAVGALQTTSQSELLAAKAQHEATAFAKNKLDEELQAARTEHAEAEAQAKTAADIVILADLRQAAQRLGVLWKEADELRNLIESARYVGLPPDREMVALMTSPTPSSPIRNAQLANYRDALMQDADAQLADQPMSRSV